MSWAPNASNLYPEAIASTVVEDKQLLIRKSSVSVQRRCRTSNGSRKRVRFSRQSPEVFLTLTLEEHSSEEIASRWWSVEESEGARLNAQYIAASAKKSSIMVGMLGDSYMRVLEAIFEGDHDQVEEYMIHPPVHFTQHLEKWSAVAHSVRGLERWVSGDQKAMRGSDARNARDLVLELYYHHDASENDIAKMYTDCTRANVVYARMTGHADQVAATCANTRAQSGGQNEKVGKERRRTTDQDFSTESAQRRLTNGMLETKSISAKGGVTQRLTRGPSSLVRKGVSCKAA